MDSSQPHLGSSNAVPEDPLRRMAAYRLAEELIDISWDDALRLSRHPVARHVAAQLFRAVGSIAANIAEGYSRSSGRDRVRLFEYALGSARECTVWYRCALPVLGVSADRQQILNRIRRILLSAIPRERARLIRQGKHRAAPLGEAL